MELMTSWMLKGIEEGRVEEAQRLALMQLQSRPGGVSERQETQIRRLSLEQLEDLAGALLDFTHSGDLDAWLQEKAGTEQQENA